MPRLKLRGWQFSIIAESLKVTAKKELIQFYHLLCDALKEEFDITDVDSVNSTIFVQKKFEALAKHQRLRDICKAKLDLFEAENRGLTLTTAQIQEVSKMQRELGDEDSLIERINEQYLYVLNIETMVTVVEGKINDTDLIKKYDDDPKVPADPDEDDNYDDSEPDPYPPSGNWGD